MVSIIVTWRNREELARSLPSLTNAAAEVGGTLTVVNFGGDDSALKQMLNATDEAVQTVHIRNQHYFNKSRAANAGASTTAEPYLFFCDCDIVIPDGAVRQLLDAVSCNSQRFATIRGVKETIVNARAAKHIECFGYELNIRTRDGRRVQIVDNEEDAADGTRQAPGLLFVSRSHFAAVRGYNGRLHGWGWEDQDMICRLTLGLGLERVALGTVTHISHDDHARVQYYPISNRWESRDKMFRQALENYNNVDFQGTLEEDKHLITNSTTKA